MQIPEKIADYLGRHINLADTVDQVRGKAEKMADRLIPCVEKASETATKLADRVLDLQDKIKTAQEKARKNRINGKTLLFLGCLFFLCGCTPTLSESTESHIIAAGHTGNPVFFDCADEKGKIIRKADEITLEQHLARMSSAMEKSGRKKIFLYCFGGMNSVESTVKISMQNTSIIMNDSDVYPIFLNWESELFACYFHYLFWVRQGVEIYWLGPPLAPVFFLSDMVEAILRLPIDMLYQSMGIFALDTSREYNEAAQLFQSRHAGIHCYMGRDNDPHTFFPLVRLGYFAGFPVRIVTTSLIRSFGSEAWQEMRRRARVAFDRDPSSLEKNLAASNRISLPPDGVFAHFAEMLRAYVRKHPDTEITLVGHSMGGFLATELLSRYPDLPIKNIVFMASTSSVQETAQVVKPYLEKKQDARFYNLCVHPFIERYDMMHFCVLPSGSVLSWGSQHLTRPISKEDHPVGIWDAAIFMLPNLMDGVESQVTIKAFGLNDPVTNTEMLDMPSQHTDFSSPKVKFWRKTFWEVPSDAARAAGKK